MPALGQGLILVTGGAGMIGSAVVWELNRRGFDRILISDHLRRSDKWRNLAPLRFLDYIEGDNLPGVLAENTALAGELRAVFHLGACSATTETDAAYLIRNNFEYTKLLAHFALARNLRFLYASSAATYGARETNLSDTAPLAELRPLNAYGYSKHLFDCYAERSGILPRLTGIKYFNIFGPNENHKGNMRSVVHKAYCQLCATGRISLFRSYRPEYADGDQRRDFLYVKDAARVTVDLAETLSGGGIYNLGSGTAETWLALAHAIFQSLGAQPQIDFIDMPEELRGKYQYYTRADLTKLRSSSINTRFTPLAAAVRDYVCNYLQPGAHLGDEASAA